MRRFLTGILVITLISILYVYQQTRLLEYSYEANSYNRSMALLVDQNRYLRYNITKLESPARLEGMMLGKKNAEVVMPRTWYKIKVEEKPPVVETQAIQMGPIIKTGRRILSIFSLDTEAIAKEPSD